jgi:hypothetical protein
LIIKSPTNPQKNTKTHPIKSQPQWEEVLTPFNHYSPNFDPNNPKIVTTQAQELSFQEAFNSFDYDNDGQIRVEEFATAIRATGLPVKIADIREMEDQIR